MKQGLIVQLTYKASHYVSRLDHPVHSNAHFHIWTVQLEVEGFIDAHSVQEWMHHQAPHFADHGDMGVEDIANWWMESALPVYHGKDGQPLAVGVRLMREDGIGAFVRAG